MLRYYIWCICVCMFIIAGLNIIFLYPLAKITIFYAIFATVFNTIAVIVADGLIAYILHSLPKKCVNFNSKFYCVSPKERKFYEKLKIRKWKDKVPEMGQLMCKFSKKKVSRNTENYLEKFLQETCYAEIVHYGMALIGVILLFFFPAKYIWTITLPVILVNFFLNIPPILIQRYNRPKLLIAYERSKKG